MHLCQVYWQQQSHWYHTDVSGQVFDVSVRASSVGITGAGVMGFLPCLHVRDLAKNFLSGTIPADLGAAHSLIKLYV